MATLKALRGCVLETKIEWIHKRIEAVGQYALSGLPCMQLSTTPSAPRTHAAALTG